MRAARFLRAATVPAVAACVLALVAGPAASHQRSPELVTVLEQIVPALPDDVVVQVQTSVADQLVVENRTAELLEVLDTAGRPFLRIGPDGVQADLARLEWYTSNDPSGTVTVPPAVRADPDAPARWAQVSDGRSWGWFDHRLHDGDADGPGGWAVPLRYAGRDVEVRGRVELRPVRGAYLVTADPAPAGLSVSPLQGRLPGLFVRLTGPGPVTVLGADGQPFARLDATGAQVFAASPTWREDRRARGLPLPDRAGGAVRVADEPALSWLDARLQPPDQEPPDDPLAGGRPTDVGRWEIPLRTPAGEAALTGRISWVPSGAAAPVADDRGGPPVAALTAAAAALAGVVALLALRARRRARA